MTLLLSSPLALSVSGAEYGPDFEPFTFASEEDGIDFYFSSGAGGWGTSMTVFPDGTFKGDYHDSDMGDSGEDYPYGTIYYSVFSGSFTEPVKINEYTYSFSLADLISADVPGSIDIIDGARYIASTPYGLDNANDFYLYLPGAPLKELPEDFLTWVGSFDLAETEDTILPKYGLHNLNEQDGFSGYPAFFYDEDDPLGWEVSYARTQGFVLETQLSYEDLPQVSLNMKSEELFNVWDQCLNNMWAYLKDALEPSAMDALTKEEIEWIKNKEAAVKAAGAENEGGSIQPLVENLAAVSWTKDRVYELYERFGVSIEADRAVG